MRTARRAVTAAVVAGLLTLVVTAAVPTVRAEDYKQAPPPDELDRRASEYVTGRRIVAILLIGGTLAGGLIGSFARRRARRRAREDAQRDDV